MLLQYYLLSTKYIRDKFTPEYGLKSGLNMEYSDMDRLAITEERKIQRTAHRKFKIHQRSTLMFDVYMF